MKRFIVLMSVLGMAVASTGCSIRYSTYEVERVDQEITGNKGALIGTAKSTKEYMGPTREMMRWEIKLPKPIDWTRLKDPKTTDEEMAGNVGVMKEGTAISTGAPEKRMVVEPERKISPAERTAPAEGKIKTDKKPHRWFMPAQKTQEWKEKMEHAKDIGPKAKFKLYTLEPEVGQEVAEEEKPARRLK